jgi:hypothetical protein
MTITIPAIRVSSSGTITASDYTPTIKRGSSVTINGTSKYIINNDVTFVSDGSTAGDQIIVQNSRGDYDVTKKNVFILRGSFE